MITTKDVARVKAQIRIGEELTYDQTELLELNGRILILKKERVTVIKKCRNLVIVTGPDRRTPLGCNRRTITYKELAFRKKGLAWEHTTPGMEQVNGIWRKK